MKIYSILKSLRTANILLALLMVLFIYGAIAMPGNLSFETINSLSLFEWIKKTLLKENWWLLGSILIISFLAVNTVLCSIDSLIHKKEGKRWLLIISPQVIHVGFCFMMIAHLVSGYSSFHKNMALHKGFRATLESGDSLTLEGIDYQVESGYMTGMRAYIVYKGQDGGQTEIKTISPNNPAFFKGIGIYLKNIYPGRVPTILVEISYEPGAIWALIGSMIFLIGTVTLVLFKMREGN